MYEHVCAYVGSHIMYTHGDTPRYCIETRLEPSLYLEEGEKLNHTVGIVSHEVIRESELVR